MHLGELGTPYVSVVTLGVPGQLMGSIHPSANCGWACRKLTLHSFEHSGILGKAINLSQASGKAGQRFSACCFGCLVL